MVTLIIAHIGSELPVDDLVEALKDLPEISSDDLIPNLDDLSDDSSDDDSCNDYTEREKELLQQIEKMKFDENENFFT